LVSKDTYFIFARYFLFLKIVTTYLELWCYGVIALWSYGVTMQSL